jgi:hypothetical protein
MASTGLPATDIIPLSLQFMGHWRQRDFKNEGSSEEVYENTSGSDRMPDDEWAFFDENAPISRKWKGFDRF